MCTQYYRVLLAGHQNDLHLQQKTVDLLSAPNNHRHALQLMYTITSQRISQFLKDMTLCKDNEASVINE